MKTLNSTSIKNCSQNSSSDSDQLVWPIQTTRICKQFENNIRIIRQHNLKTTGNNPKRWICVDFSKIVSIIASENPLRDGLSWIENSTRLKKMKMKTSDWIVCKLYNVWICYQMKNKITITNSERRLPFIDSLDIPTLRYRLILILIVCSIFET